MIECEKCAESYLKKKLIIYSIYKGMIISWSEWEKSAHDDWWDYCNMDKINFKCIFVDNPGPKKKFVTEIIN